MIKKLHLSTKLTNVDSKTNLACMFVCVFVRACIRVCVCECMCAGAMGCKHCQRSCTQCVHRVPDTGEFRVSYSGEFNKAYYTLQFDRTFGVHIRKGVRWLNGEGIDSPLWPK